MSTSKHMEFCVEKLDLLCLDFHTPTAQRGKPKYLIKRPLFWFPLQFCAFLWALVPQGLRQLSKIWFNATAPASSISALLALLIISSPE